MLHIKMFIGNAVQEIIQTNKNGEFAGHVQIGILASDWMCKTTGCLTEPEVLFSVFLGASGIQGKDILTGKKLVKYFV